MEEFGELQGDEVSCQLYQINQKFYHAACGAEFLSVVQIE